MFQSTFNYLRSIACLSFACLLSVSFFLLNAYGQTTAFTYQGKLTDAGNPANGNYDMQFKLFDTVTVGTGTQQGATITNPTVQVASGIFAVNLDFGANVFTGAARFLEIGVRPAGSPNPYTVLEPRQVITASPYAIQTLNASGTSGTFSFAGIAPPPVAPAGQGRLYFDTATNKMKVSENGAAFVNLVGATGVSGSGTTNTIPLWSAGTTLGNSLITQANGGIQLPNSVQLAAGAQGNSVGFGSPNSETGMTISGASGRVDLRFDGTLKLVAGSSGIPSATNGIAITTAGNVGIGTTTPNGKLEVNAGGSGGAIRFHTPNAESGMSIIGTNRADVRFDGTTLKLLAGLGVTSPCCGIAIDTAGNVGIGTTTPNTRLTVSGGAPWTSAFWTASMNLQNLTALGWEANASGQRFGIGRTNGGLYFFRTNSAFGDTSSPANYDMVINDNGNITQPLSSNGLVKAMLYVQQDGVILQCYNGITNSTTGNCGFTVNHLGDGAYNITFPFQVSNRFLSITARNPADPVTNVSAAFRFDCGSNCVFVKTSITNVTTTGDDANFMLIIY